MSLSMLPKETFLLQLDDCPSRNGESSSMLFARSSAGNEGVDIPGVDNRAGLGSGASAVAGDPGLASIGGFVGALSAEAGVASRAGA